MPEWELFKDNRYYGHARILKQYAGLPTSLPLPVTVQHGWYPYRSLEPSILDNRFLLRPHWLWSQRDAYMYKEIGLEEVVVGGAPFVYLADEVWNGRSEDSAGTAVFPSHSTQLKEVMGDYTRYARELESLPDEFKPITVCLYYRDLERQLDTPFRERGFHVTTNGSLDDPRFLERFISNCAGVRYTTSNALATACLYSVYLGLQFFICGPKMRLHNRGDPPHPLGFVKLKSGFPEIEDRLHIDNVGDRQFQQSWARDELGAKYKMSRRSLREMLMKLMLRGVFLWRFGTQFLGDLRKRSSFRDCLTWR